MLTEAAIKGKVDNLIGLKENVIIGKLIPVGTGMKRYRNIRLNTDEVETIAFDEGMEHSMEESYSEEETIAFDEDGAYEEGMTEEAEAFDRTQDLDEDMQPDALEDPDEMDDAEMLEADPDDAEDFAVMGSAE